MARRLALLVLALLACVGAAVNVAMLSPNVLATDQLIVPNEPVVYELDTAVGQAYEIKLSYRATTPSFFNLRVLDATESTQRSSRHSMRRVLNTEKTFVTGNGNKQYVEVTMQVEGISYRLTDAEMATRATKFDILLEELVLGGLPVSAISLIAVAVVFLLLMLLVVYPRVSALVHDAHAAPSKRR
ncbi:hypothetical protein ACHHYP_01178 [Achlya hypogyna]|uniref:Secreted protein n=1 Tax=Achlya hypogyna TaxID=1202772 RepID=A0A1V9ZTJ5_ACHHY|nr:hypothetical protein ACHHYP_01178 [Achlya hypogyna]